MIYSVYLPFLGDPQRGVELAEKGARLNPRFPDWYLQCLRVVYFFGEKFDKSLAYSKQIKDRFQLDYAYIAMNAAYLGDAAEAKAAAAEVARLDPTWSAEAWISSQGGFAREKENNLFVDGARKAGLPLCASDEVVRQQPNLLRLKMCDDQRARGVSG